MIHVLGGGTFSFCRSHLALAAPAFGETARRIENLIASRLIASGELFPQNHVELHLTKMADPRNLAPTTNEDVEALVIKMFNPDTLSIYGEVK